MNQEDLKWRKIGETNTCEKWSLDGEAYIDVPIGILDTIRQEERRKTIEEIIENIPVCRDRITKCNCSNHDINDDVFNYLSTLENKKHE